MERSNASGYTGQESKMPGLDDPHGLANLPFVCTEVPVLHAEMVVVHAAPDHHKVRRTAQTPSQRVPASCTGEHTGMVRHFMRLSTHAIDENAVTAGRTHS